MELRCSHLRGRLYVLLIVCERDGFIQCQFVAVDLIANELYSQSHSKYTFLSDGVRFLRRS